jgi:uncharacterized tellurite resistance protein B-like protein
MFADKLSPEQRQVVFDLAVNLANADNELCKEEIEYLQSFSSAFGIKYDLNKEIHDFDDSLTLFSDRKSKVILLQELLKLSYKDGHFGKEEQDKVFMISQKLGFNNLELILKIEKWVRDGVNWQYEGLQMIEN